MLDARIPRLGVSEFSTYSWTFEEDVINYHAHGFGAIGLWRAKVADYGEEKASELLRENDMRVSSLHWAGGFTGSDGRSFRDAMYDALDAIELAATLQAETLVVMAGSRSGHTRNHARRLLKLALQELAEAAESVGVDLAVEPMHMGCAYDCTFLTDIPSTLDIIASIGRRNLGIVFDCYHMAQEENVVEWLSAIVPLVRLVQLGDAKRLPMGEQNRCLLGQGRIPLDAIIQTFEAHGYRGCYEVELCGEEIEHLDYEYVLRQAHSSASQMLAAACPVE
jgi:sugar phosphate isomerase/epimerase